MKQYKPFVGLLVAILSYHVSLAQSNIRVSYQAPIVCDGSPPVEEIDISVSGNINSTGSCTQNFNYGWQIIPASAGKLISQGCNVPSVEVEWNKAKLKEIGTASIKVSVYHHAYSSQGVDESYDKEGSSISACRRECGVSSTSSTGNLVKEELIPVTYAEISPPDHAISAPSTVTADPEASINFTYTDQDTKAAFYRMTAKLDGEQVASGLVSEGMVYKTDVLGSKTFTITLSNKCRETFTFTKTVEVLPVCRDSPVLLPGYGWQPLPASVQTGSSIDKLTFGFDFAQDHDQLKGYQASSYSWQLYRTDRYGKEELIAVTDQDGSPSNRTFLVKVADLAPEYRYYAKVSVELASSACPTITSKVYVSDPVEITCQRSTITLNEVWESSITDTNAEGVPLLTLGASSERFSFEHNNVAGITFWEYEWWIEDQNNTRITEITNWDTRLGNKVSKTFIIDPDWPIGRYHTVVRVTENNTCLALSPNVFRYAWELRAPCPAAPPRVLLEGEGVTYAGEHVYQVKAPGKSATLRLSEVPYLSDLYQWNGADFSSSVKVSPELPVTYSGDQSFAVVFDAPGVYTFSPVATHFCEATTPPIKVYVFFNGEQAVTLSQVCPIYLPEDLPTLVEELSLVGLPADLSVAHLERAGVLESMQWTIESRTQVVVGPGITLENGGSLTVDRGDADNLLSGQDQYWNFTLLSSYDDFGHVIAEGKQYFDASGRLSQRQHKDLSRQLILAQQPVYDYYGRASVSSLVAPIRGGGSAQYSECPEYFSVGFGYQDNLLQALDGRAYDAFDVREHAPVGQAPGTIGWYYSQGNDREAVGQGSEEQEQSLLLEERVATTKYPFVKTLYKEDGSGEVVGQTLPGDFQYRSEEVVIEGVKRKKTSLAHVAHREMQALDEGDTELMQDYLSKRGQYTGQLYAQASVRDKFYKQVSEDANGRRSVSYYNEAGQLLTSLYYGSKESIITQSYGFYDDRGRMVASLDPKELVTKYEYDFRGRLLSMDEADAGKTEYVYRKDGSIRFSQNSKQREENKFSYTHYDAAGRATESGQWTPSDANISISSLRADKDLLEQRDNTLPAGATVDVVKTSYDGQGHAVAPSKGKGSFLMGKVSYSEKLDETGQKVSSSWYSYDERGRVVWTVQDIAGLGVKTVDYTYNGQGNVRVVAYQAEDEQEDFYHYYEYDADTRLSKVYTSTTKPEYQADEYTLKNLDQFALQASYEYYLHGPLKQVTLADGLQDIDYTYTVQGWLKAINNPNDTDNPDKDVFAMQLDYFSGDYAKTGSGIVSNAVATQDYSGNIQQQQWRTKTPAIANLVGNQVANAYQYQYDERYQLQSAVFGSISNQSFVADAQQAYSTTSLDYDKNGNILGLQRRGQNGTLLHDFAGKYQYKPNTNQLSSVTGYKSYSYNAIGQMTEEVGTDGSQKLNYDVSGKVREVRDENDALIAQYQYDDKGYRVSKQSYENGSLVKTTYYVRDASGSLMSTYEQEASQAVAQTEVPVYGSSRVGLYQAVDQRTEYYLTDHLGNTRAIVNRERLSNGGVDVSYFADYMAYGALARSAGSKPRFGYQGSFAEDETELRGTAAFELRDWDPVIGRWTAVDPYRQFHSPYVGMGNNPVSNVDPDGGCTGNDPDCQNVGGYESSSMKYDAGLDAYVLQGSAVASAGMSAQQASQARFNSHVYGAGAAFWDHEVTQATVFAASFLIGAEAYLLARGFQGAKAAVRGVGLVDDVAKSVSNAFKLNRHGELTNGVYTVSTEAMKKHVVGGVPGKSIFYPTLDANKAVLKAAQYADEAGLWIGNKAKVPVLNTNIGTLGNGTPTNVINVYRKASGTIHGSPGTIR